ncbi:hypothetical protein [Metabacillus indicus]|uniref:hypothetical protein n=1 Tax=Metabacillus indicus TaxID=246786 RepID=UPI0004938CA5|nr:hypothetical protein [Metabacillus indicus]KEZ52485.1 hypothetical protein AZ46_0201525 [Metabacillus indicus LMG 22858]
MNNMKRTKTIVLSIIISLLVFPAVLGFENSENLLMEYARNFVFCTVYGGPFLLIAGVPVHLLAGFIVEKIERFKLTVSFLIHILPAAAIGFALFGEAAFLIGIPVISAAVFFAVDALIFRRVIHPAKIAGIVLLPVLIYGLMCIPQLIQKAEFRDIKNEPRPMAELTVNEQTSSIRLGSCWDSDDSSGCPIDREPYLLPTDDVGVTEFQVDGEAFAELNFLNTDRSFTLEVYYLTDDGVEQIKTDQNGFTLPDGIKEQVIKGTATMDNSQKVSFSVGIRSGNR